MILNLDLDRYELPVKFLRGGRSCFLDPVRKRLIVQTPEEVVRQRMVKFLGEKMQVPAHCIELEIPISHFKKGAKGRADIIVYAQDEETFYPVLIIECKAPSVELIDDIFDQVAGYNEILNAVAIMATNGLTARIWAQDDEQTKYIPLRELPQYRYLVEKNGFKYVEEEPEPWVRPEFEERPGKELVQFAEECGWIANTTPTDQYPLIINLAGLLNDETHKLPPQEISGIRFLQDGGLRYTRFGNAGGNDVYGDYRYFVIEDNAANTQIVSLLLCGFDSHENPQWSYKKGATVVVVAIDDFENSRMSLMLNFNKHVQLIAGKFARIAHNASITVGKRGMVRQGEFREFLQNKYPNLLGKDGQVELGVLDLTQEMNWSRNDVRQFLANIVKYVIAREHFRKEKNQDVNSKKNEALKPLTTKNV